RSKQKSDCALALPLNSKSGSGWPRPAYYSNDPDQQTCANEPGNQVTEPSSQIDSKEAKNGARNGRSDDAEHNVHDKSHVTLHELFCQPACDTADDNGCNPAYLWIVHGVPLLLNGPPGPG